MSRVAITGSVLINAAACFVLGRVGKPREPRIPDPVTWISVVEAEHSPRAAMRIPPTTPSRVAPPATRAASPHDGNRRTAPLRRDATPPPIKEIRFVSVPSPEPLSTGNEIVPGPPTPQPNPPRAVVSPVVPHFDAPGLRPLPRQTISIVPDYDWAWGGAGAVRMRIDVRPTGEVAFVEFIVPSGSQALDIALDAGIRARTFAPCVWESGEATECTIDYRFDYVVTRHANGVRQARTCGHVEDGQPSCCDAFER